jgi:hypothetical protein
VWYSFEEGSFFCDGVVVVSNAWMLLEMFSLRWCCYISSFLVICLRLNVVYGLHKYDRKDLHNLRYVHYCWRVTCIFLIWLACAYLRIGQYIQLVRGPAAQIFFHAAYIIHLQCQNMQFRHRGQSPDL